MHSPTIQKLIDLFSKFPTVGPRTAARFVFYLIAQPKEKVKELVQVMADLKNKINLCKMCFNASESEKDFCEICADTTKDKSKLCIVEKGIDLEALEKINKYNGLYFILGGAVSNLKPETLEKLRLVELDQRVKNPEIKEIIIATNSTSEGQATALYLKRKLASINKKIVQLGRGLPVGGELEYADEETLTSALESRR